MYLQGRFGFYCPFHPATSLIYFQVTVWSCQTSPKVFETKTAELNTMELCHLLASRSFPTFHPLNTNPVSTSQDEVSVRNSGNVELIGCNGDLLEFERGKVRGFLNL